MVPGDTLSEIAQSFGITPETILWANGLDSGELLRVGQKLTILPVSGVLHEVKAGESLLGIAAAHGADPGQVVEANLLSDPSLIREGNLLIIPGGKPTTLPTVPSGGPTSAGATETLQYTVKSGDTLSLIASNFGVRASALQEANDLASPDLLRVGQLLSIPGGQHPQAAAPSAPAPPEQEQTHESTGGDEQERSASSRGGERDGRSFIATVTAYAIQGRTATGTPTRWGVVAVDPRVIPLGSKIRIDGFEELFVAEDTGGAVRGNWVDIWFPSYAEAFRFGLQSRRVTLVEP